MNSSTEPESVTIGAAPGPVLEVLALGATLYRLEVSAPDGSRRDVVLGQAVGQTSPTGYVGATIGRYANRIAGGRFELDGREVVLAGHDRGNNLHGGPDGFDRRTWTVADRSADAVTLTLHSPDGDQGFPGAVDACVTFEVDGDTVRVRLGATTDAPTVVNLTSHVYVNLDDVETIDDHELTLEADEYLPVDDTGIPLGAPAPVDGTPLDFRSPRRVGPDAIDHDVLVRGEGLRRAARVSGRSGVTVELWSDQPGLQVYTGDFLDPADLSKDGGPMQPRSGLALEPQHHPDSPHHPEWPSTVLRPGETYATTIEWRFV